MTDFERFQQFRSLPFPRALRGEEINGIELVLLDADIVGCLDQYYGRTGTMEQLEEPWNGYLRTCQRDLRSILTQLEGEGHMYFTTAASLVDSVISQLDKHDSHGAGEQFN